MEAACGLLFLWKCFCHLYAEASNYDWKEGTLYPLLHQMEGKGWIQSEWQVAEGRRRKVYNITNKGHGELAKQKEEWVRLQVAIANVLGEAT